MATDAVPASQLSIDRPIESEPVPAAGEGVAMRPYAPSWVDHLVAWLERLPGPTALAYLGLMVVAVLGSLVEPLLDGTTDPIVLAGQAFWGVALPLTLWLASHLSGVAGSAFDTFRPALTAGADDAARLRYELTVTPARPAVVIVVLCAALTPLYYVVDPAASGVVGLSPLGMALRYASEVVFGSLIFVLLYQSARQLRRVARIHAFATRVDLFRPAPLYAFSVLTSRTAIVIALVFVVPTLVAMAQTSFTGGWALVIAPWILLGIGAAAAVFVLPLRGMQQRIVAEKRRLQAEVGLRLETTMAAIHRSVDAGDIVGAGAMHDALTALTVERELVDKLPTLPWRPGTLGGLVTAIALPLGLFVVTRLLERVI